MFQFNTLNLAYNLIINLKINNNNNLLNLRIIILTNNQISDLSEFKLPFIGLEKLDLSFNQIVIFNLKGNYSNLKLLDLSKTQIEY